MAAPASCPESAVKTIIVSSATGSTFKRWLAALAACGLLALEPAPAAGQSEVPADRQVLILSRALAYDGELKARVGNDIQIAVLAKSGHAASEAMGIAMLKAFRAILNLRVQGLTLGLHALSYTTTAALASAMTTQGIDVLYVCVGLEPELAAIVELTRKRHVISLGSSEEQVSRGLALGVFPVESRPTIVVNLPAARHEGASFSSDLLRVAKVIRAETR
jgi:hypothetical protein